MLFQLQPGMRFNPVGCEFSVHESTIAMWWRVFKQKRTENMAVQRLGPHPWPLPGRGLSVLSSGRVGSGLTVWLPRAAGVRDSLSWAPLRVLGSGSEDGQSRTSPPSPPRQPGDCPWNWGRVQGPALICGGSITSQDDTKSSRPQHTPFPVLSTLSLSLCCFLPRCFSSILLYLFPSFKLLIASFWICCRIRRVWGAAAGPLGSEDRGGWPPEAARRGDMEASEPGARCRAPLVWTASTACGCMQRWGDCSRRRG